MDFVNRRYAQQIPKCQNNCGNIPPFRDHKMSMKAHKANIQVQAHFCNDNQVNFADNNTICYVKDPDTIFQTDGIHLKDLGFKRLMQNLKKAIFRHTDVNTCVQ